MLRYLPQSFICFHCKKQSTEDEISSLINHPYNHSHLKRKGIFDNQSIYKDYEPKKNFL